MTSSASVVCILHRTSLVLLENLPNYIDPVMVFELFLSVASLAEGRRKMAQSALLKVP